MFKFNQTGKGKEGAIMRRTKDEEEVKSYLLIVFEKYFEVDVKAQNRMSSKALKKHLVHRNRLLECRQVLPEQI